MSLFTLTESEDQPTFLNVSTSPTVYSYFRRPMGKELSHFLVPFSISRNRDRQKSRES